MHVDHESVEFVPVDEQDYEEVIEEYEEEILVQEDVPKPPITDFADTMPAQGKTRCLTLIFNNNWIYMCCAFTLQAFYENYMHKYIYS